jgi:hypothetical protein
MRSLRTVLYAVAVAVVAIITPAGCTTTALAQEELNRAWDATPFTALRLAYSQRSDFDPACMSSKPLGLLRRFS